MPSATQTPKQTAMGASRPGSAQSTAEAARPRRVRHNATPKPKKVKIFKDMFGPVFNNGMAKKPEYMLDREELDECIRFPEKKLESQVDKIQLNWDNATELVSTLDQTGHFTECLKVLGLQLNPLQVALAILESRNVDVSDPGIIAQAMKIDIAAATEFVADHQIATTEAEKRARRLLEAGGDETRARAMAVAEYRNALFEAMDLHIKKVLELHDDVFSFSTNTLSISSLEGVPTFRLAKSESRVDRHASTWSSFQDRYVGENSTLFQARPWTRVEERHARRVLEIEDEIKDLEKKKRDLFGNIKGWRAFEEQIAARKHELESLEYAVKANAATAAFETRHIPSRPLSALYRQSGPLIPVTGSPSAAASAFLISRTLSRERPGVAAFLSKQQMAENEYVADGTRRNPRCPFINLPMLEATTGLHSRAGLMMHTGAICPVQDQSWQGITDDHAPSLRISGARRQDGASDGSVSSGPMTARSGASAQSLGGYEEVIRRGFQESRQRSMVKLGSQVRLAGSLAKLGSAVIPGGKDASGGAWGRRRSVVGRLDSFVDAQETAMLDDMGSLDLDLVSSYAHHVKTAKQRDNRAKLGQVNPFAERDRDINNGAVAREPGKTQPEAVLRGELVAAEGEVAEWIRGVISELSVVSPMDKVGFASPAFSPIVVCGREWEVASVVERTAPGRVSDLVLFQGGMARSAVARIANREQVQRAKARFGVDGPHAARRRESLRVPLPEQPETDIIQSRPAGPEGFEGDGRAPFRSRAPSMAERRLSAFGSRPSSSMALKMSGEAQLLTNLNRRTSEAAGVGPPRLSSTMDRQPSAISVSSRSGARPSQDQGRVKGAAELRRNQSERPAHVTFSGPAKKELVELQKRHYALSLVTSWMLHLFQVAAPGPTEGPETAERIKLLRDRETMMEEITTQLRGLREAMEVPNPEKRARDRELSVCVDEGEVTVVLLNGRPHPSGAILCGGPSYVTGRYSSFVCQLLERGMIHCVHVPDPAEFDARAVEKLMLDSALWLLCHCQECRKRPGPVSDSESLAAPQRVACGPVPGGNILRFHLASLHRLLGEMMAIGRRALGHHVSVAMGADGDVLARIEAMLSVFEHTVASCETAKRALLFTNGWFLSRGEASAQPFHIELLEELGVNVGLLALQAESERLGTLKLLSLASASS